MYLESKNKTGFTLIEMIVATAIFAIVSTICMGIYIATIKANSKILALQKVQNEIRYSIDYIAKEIRLGSIDYARYNNNINSPVQELAILDNSQNTILFRKHDGRLQMQRGQLFWADISGDNVRFDSLNFYISPSEYPPSNSDEIIQGLVTIVMDVYDKQQNSNILIQTTISLRNYKQ